MKILHGSERHIKFRKILMSPGVMKIFPTNLVDRCMMAIAGTLVTLLITAYSVALATSTSSRPSFKFLIKLI